MANPREILPNERVANQPATEGLRVHFERTAVNAANGEFANQAANSFSATGDNNWSITRDAAGNLQLAVTDGALPETHLRTQTPNELCFRRQFDVRSAIGSPVNPDAKMDEVVRLTKTVQGWEGAQIDSLSVRGVQRAQLVYQLKAGIENLSDYNGQPFQNFGYGNVNQAVRQLEARGANPFNSYAGGNYYRGQDSAFTGTQAGKDNARPYCYSGNDSQTTGMQYGKDNARPYCYSGNDSQTTGMQYGKNNARVYQYMRQDSAPTGMQYGKDNARAYQYMRQDSAPTGMQYGKDNARAYQYMRQDSAPTGMQASHGGVAGQTAIPEGFHPAEPPVTQAETSTALKFHTEPAKHIRHEQRRQPVQPEVKADEKVQGLIIHPSEKTAEANYRTTTDNTFKGNDL